MKIIVTGGSGYLGTHVRHFFSADDFSRRSNLDVLNIYDAQKVADYDVVIHLAAHLDKNPKAADQCFRTNSEGTLNLIRNMKPGSVFIYASTKDVYGPHAGTYADVPETCSTEFANHSALEWSKLIGEKYVNYYAAKQNVRACIFRLSAVYARPSSGNDNGFVTHYVESVKHSLPLHIPAKVNPVRDILFVDDFSRACQAFIDSSCDSGLFNLGGGRENAASLREIIVRIGTLIQLQPVIEEDEKIPIPVPLNYISDLTLVKAKLGWEPQVKIDDGLRNLL